VDAEAEADSKSIHSFSEQFCEFIRW
jgi:hypothetical protein